MHPYLLPVFLLTVAMSSSLFASGAESTMVSPVSADAVVWIKSPQDGQRVSSPVTLSFGNSNVAISPAGTERANSGHHHLLINLQELPAMDMPLPASAQVIHFGKGQNEKPEHRLFILARARPKLLWSLSQVSTACSYCWATICMYPMPGQ